VITVPEVAGGPGTPPLSGDGFALRPAVSGDAATIAEWMAQPHVSRWWQQDWPASRWAAELATQTAGDHSLPCIATLDGAAFGYVELYRVRHDRLARYYDSDDHDWGLHVAIGEVSSTGRGLGRRFLAATAEALLRGEPRCSRVVAEPDVRNVPSVRAFTAAGFRSAGEVDLPEKTAVLMIRDRTPET
jgi:RimJ/RimL family protein N-acetyltransferase